MKLFKKLKSYGALCDTECPTSKQNTSSRFRFDDVFFIYIYIFTNLQKLSLFKR